MRRQTAAALGFALLAACALTAFAADPVLLYSEDFEEMELGSLKGQKGWNISNSGHEGLVSAGLYGNPGQCVLAKKLGGQSGAYYTFPEPPEDIVVQARVDFYWPSDSPATDSYLLFNEYGSSHRKGQISIKPEANGLRIKYAEGKEIYSVEDFHQAPYDTWVTMGYTLDLRAQKILNFFWDGETNEFQDAELALPDLHSLTSFCVCFYHKDSQADVAFDNVEIYELPRESGPVPALERELVLGHGDSGSLLLSNLGSGSFAYSLSFSDFDDVLSVSEPQGDVAESATIRVSLDRSCVEDGFYRTFLLADCGECGVLTSRVSFAAGSVYYFCDFEGPMFHDGAFEGQDGWESDHSTNVANVLTTNDNRTVLIEYGGGNGGYKRSLDVPRGSIMKVEFDFLVPEADFADLGDASRIAMYLKQHSRSNPLREIMVNLAVDDGQPVVYGTVKDALEDFPRVESVGEFLHCSYVMDLEQGLLLEFDLDDAQFIPSEDIPLSGADTPCNLLCLCVAKHMNIQVDNISVSVLPEPSLLAGALLLALAVRRRP